MGQLHVVHNDRVGNIDDALVVGCLCIRQDDVQTLAHAVAHILDFGDSCGLEGRIRNGETKRVEVDALHLINERRHVAVGARFLFTSGQFEARNSGQLTSAGESNQLVIVGSLLKFLDSLNTLVYSGRICVQIYGDIKASGRVFDDRNMNIVTARTTIFGLCSKLFCRCKFFNILVNRFQCFS